MKKRVIEYDWMKIFATLLVIINHANVYGYSTPNGGMGVDAYVNVNAAFTFGATLYRNIAAWSFPFATMTFFILSGSALAFREVPSFDKLAKSRGQRLLVPYFVCAFLWLIPIKTIAGFYSLENISSVCLGVFSGQDSGHLWFLPALFWITMAWAILYKLVHRFSDSDYLVLLIAFFISFNAYKMQFDILHLRQALGYLIWFTVGYVFEKERQKANPWSIQKKIVCIIILIAIELIDWKYLILDDFFKILVSEFLMFMIANMLSMAFSNISSSRVWRWVIGNLFCIYLFHDPYEYLLLKLFYGHGLMTSAIGCHVFLVLRVIGAFILGAIWGDIVHLIIRTLKKLFEKQS